MPNARSHDTPTTPDSGGLSAAIDDWLRLFLKHLDLELISEFDQSRTDSAEPSLHQLQDHTLRAVLRTLQDSGMTWDEVLKVTVEAAPRADHAPAEWTQPMNARRFELIDREVLGTISLPERIELAQLTRRLRDSLADDRDSEGGALRLLERLNQANRTESET